MEQRVVVVTGGTGALGTSVVERFREAGDTVVPISRSAGEYGADLSDAAQVRRVIDQVAERFGRIDVAVHTVGAYEGGAKVHDTPAEAWMKMLNVNFFTTLYVCSSVVPHMIGAGRGRIVAVGSRVGVAPAAGLGPYGVSKAALNALIETVAAELRDTGITANVVLPSTIDTGANRKWGSPEQVSQWVKPASIAETIFWLASEGAADVNGALIPVYGRA